MDAAARAIVRRLADRIGRLERDVRAQARAAQTRHRSVEGGALSVYDEDGVLRQVIGSQKDGTYTATDHNGPTPPKPDAPDVGPYPGGVLVRWNGLFADDDTPAPTDLKHLEVHASQDPTFVPNDDTQRATMPSQKGGTAALKLSDDATWYVRLVAVSTSRKESEPSDVAAMDAYPADAVRFYEDTRVVQGPGQVKMALTHVPIAHSEHLYWNGLYQPASEWTRDERVVTIPDTTNRLLAGDQLTMEYAYRKASALPPYLVVDLSDEVNVSGAGIGGGDNNGYKYGTGPIWKDDDDATYVSFAGQYFGPGEPSFFGGASSVIDPTSQPFDPARVLRVYFAVRFKAQTAGEKAPRLTFRQNFAGYTYAYVVDVAPKPAPTGWTDVEVDVPMSAGAIADFAAYPTRWIAILSPPSYNSAADGYVPSGTLRFDVSQVRIHVETG